MSLDSDFKLSQDFAFRGKVAAATSRAALDIIQDSETSEAQKKFAKDVLRRSDYFVERFYVTIAATDGIDTSSIDVTILAAVRRLILMLS